MKAAMMSAPAAMKIQDFIFAVEAADGPVVLLMLIACSTDTDSVSFVSWGSGLGVALFPGAGAWVSGSSAAGLVSSVLDGSGCATGGASDRGA